MSAEEYRLMEEFIKIYKELREMHTTECVSGIADTDELSVINAAISAMVMIMRKMKEDK